MGYIRNNLLAIDINGTTDRQMMIDLYMILASRIPLFARKVNSYVVKHHLPLSGRRSNPFFARTLAELSPSDIVQKNAYELPDGWVAHLNADAYGYKHIIQCIENTFDIKLRAEFNN